MKILFVSDTIAFHSILTEYDTIEIGSTLIFDRIILNEGDACVLIIISISVRKVLMLLIFYCSVILHFFQL